MRILPTIILVAAIGIAAAAGGYWFGQSQIAQTAPTPARKILYYRNPMGQPDTSPVPKKDSMGMDYIPVYADQGSAAQSTAPAGGQGPILYYRNPMGLPDTSPLPKKDSMGMDYIPVYANGNANNSGGVNISPERVQQLGVRSEAVAARALARTVQSVGTVEADERRFYVVNTKFDGWIEKLDVAATGQTVKRGEKAA